MSKRIIIGLGILILLAIAGGLFFFLPRPAQAPTTSTGSTVSDNGSAAAHVNLIRADSPQVGATISSPLDIAGQARGTWYFEATFPYELDAADGTVLAQGPAQAQGDWTTTDFVPFLATIDFPAQPSGSKGVLKLKKDNPSGDPSKDDVLLIPIVFQ